VVGTRRRSWQHHPGNAFYRDIIIKYVDRVLDKNDTTPPRIFAQKIVDVITKDKDAVFLRADEERGGWYVMDETSALNKVMLALKNAEIKASKEGGVGASAADQGNRRKSKGKRKKPSSSLVNQESFGHKQDLPPLDYKEGPPPKPVKYAILHEVKEGPSVTIDTYAKDIINLMCRQTNPIEAATVLDTPLASHFKSVYDEPDHERRIRLQLRQRYIAAMTIGKSPVEFSKQLMEIWGGSVVERKVVIGVADTWDDGGQQENMTPVATRNDPEVNKSDDEELVDPVRDSTAVIKTEAPAEASEVKREQEITTETAKAEQPVMKAEPVV
jgi:hypothetical protein